MSFKEEELTVTVGQQTRTFKICNRKRTSKGVLYMDNAEYVAHKQEQIKNMEDSIRQRQLSIRIIWEDGILQDRTEEKTLKRLASDEELEQLRQRLGASRIERIQG